MSDAALARVDQLALWQQQLAGASSALPQDRADAGLHSRDGRTLELKLNQTLTRQLLQVAPATYRTQVNDLLLSALARVICRWSGQASTLVQLEGHGREELFADLDEPTSALDRTVQKQVVDLLRDLQARHGLTDRKSVV